ncbi:hypothetical protein V3W47_17025 [Deinococcus sp. YIM 134068]|uniref:hypothetical protein n=1 Tax=Deinococcus lichenicola TaxID=3118910 RepID=UPI002F956EE6
MDVSPEQFERMAKATHAAYSVQLVPSLHLTLEPGPEPEQVRFLLRRQTTPSAETFGAAAVVLKSGVDADGVEAFQRVLDHLLELHERDALPPLPEEAEAPVVCEYGAEGFRAS